MITQISANEFASLVNGAEGALIAKGKALILVSTPTCVKCRSILEKWDDVEKELGDIPSFVYKFNGEPEGIKVLSDLGVMGVPFAIAVVFNPEANEQKGEAKHSIAFTNRPFDSLPGVLAYAKTVADSAFLK